jgi:hypothetical protein
MTPKEKAEELLNKMKLGWMHSCTHFMAKKCVLITIDEVIDACEINMVESYNTDWWNKVKQELELL